MTFREKLKKDNPDFVGDDFMGGCAGCPSYFGYEDEEDSPCCHKSKDYVSNEELCRICWNREYGEDKIKQSSMYSFIAQRFMKQRDSNLG